MPNHRSPVRPQIGWTSANGLGVLVITVEKGSEPLYYVDSRVHPARHGLPTGDGLRGSRCLDSFHAREAAEGPQNHPELSALADVLANVRRWSDTDSEMRSLKPWIEDWSADAEVYASKLRDLSVSDWAIESHVNERLGSHS